MRTLARHAFLNLIVWGTLAGACGPGPSKPEVIPPSITAHPQDQSVEEGQRATFAVQASGTEPLSYQWQLLEGAEWSDLPGATEASYVTPAATLASHGTPHRCVVTNEKGSATSDPATLTVVRLPPVFTFQPSDQTVDEGEAALFTVGVSGAGSITFQWQILDGLDWTDLPGATQVVWAIPETTLADDGKSFPLRGDQRGRPHDLGRGHPLGEPAPPRGHDPPR